MDRRRALTSIGASEPKTNIIHCVYRATVDFYYSFTDSDGLWFGQVSSPWNNPVTNAFILTTI